MVNLRVPVALKAAIDLVKYDQLIIQDSLLRRNIINLEQMVIRKDEQVADLKSSIDRFKELNSYQTALTKELEAKCLSWEKNYKKQVRMGRFSVVMLGGSIATCAYLLLKK